MPDSRSAAQIAAEAMEGLDDSLNPITDESVVVEDEKHEDKSTDDDKSTEDKDDDHGYAIDEVDGDHEEEKEEPIAKKEETTSQYTPEQQYILDNLPSIKVRGIVGDDEEVKEFTVYDPRQLPEGFKYLNDRDHDIAVKEFGLIETRARELQNDYRNQESAKAQKSYKEQEEKADWDDIRAMQKAKELPLFKLKPTDPNFDNDETAQLIEKVIDFKDEINAKHLATYNAGGPYRHIGFEDAYYKYIKKNPQVNDDKQAKEDTDRKELARRTRGTNSDTAKGGSRPPVMLNKQDIDAYIDSLEF